jgi:uroporphyrinogen decarboxylase
MTSKERVRQAIMRKEPDRLPANYEAVGRVTESLLKRYGYGDVEQLLERLEIDVRGIGAKYVGPPLRRWEENGAKFSQSYWGWVDKSVWTGREYNSVTSHFPLDGMSTVEELLAYSWPSADWFDYESVKEQCRRHSGKALIFGHEGPFQISTFLRSMERLFVDMLDEPEFAHTIFGKMNEFEMEFYERVLIAGGGQIDILRPHDDYGTQISLLFSVDTWREFFEENTKKLAALAHRYGAFYQQHSCGAVRPLLPEFIRCGVDVLEPVQKVAGLEPAEIKREFGDRLAFHGGIDTQGVLPFGTAAEVRAETQRVAGILGDGGGYILMASQSFEGDVPPENIEALYSVR